MSRLLALVLLTMSLAPTTASAQRVEAELAAPGVEAEVEVQASEATVAATEAEAAAEAETEAPASRPELEEVPPPPAYAGPAPSAALRQPVPQASSPQAAGPTVRGPLPRPARGGYMPTWPLLVPGLAAFVSTYASGALAVLQLSGSGIDEGWNWLYVPLIGPFVVAGNEDLIVGDDGVRATFVLQGIFEVLGAGFIVAGLAINSRGGPEEPEVSVAPVISPTLTGLTASGRF